MGFSVKAKIQDVRSERQANRDYATHMETAHEHVGKAWDNVILNPTLAREEANNAYTEFRAASNIAKALVDQHGPFRNSYGTKLYNSARLALAWQPRVRPLAEVARKSA